MVKKNKFKKIDVWIELLVNLSTLHFQWCLPSVKEMLAIKFWRTSCSRMDSKTRNPGNGHMLQNRQRRNRRRKSHLTWSKCSLLHLLYLVPWHVIKVFLIDWLLLKRLFIHAHQKKQQVKRSLSVSLKVMKETRF